MLVAAVVVIIGISTLREFFLCKKKVHCVKCVRVRSYSGLYFPALGLNTGRSTFLIQCKCRKIQTRKTPNTDIFYVVVLLNKFYSHIQGLLLNLFELCHSQGQYRQQRQIYSRDLEIIALKFLKLL